MANSAAARGRLVGRYGTAAAGAFFAALVALFGASGMAWAVPVTISAAFMNLENRGVNSLGFSTGQFLRIGANSVVPNGAAGTSGVGTTLRLDTGSVVTQSIPFDFSPDTPNFFARFLPDDLGLRGAWTLAFTNGANTSSVVVNLASNARQAPFVNSITLSGSSANPTFTWTAPAGTTVNGYRVNIYDKSLISATNSGEVSSRNLLPAQTSYTVTAADFTVPGYAFALGKNYSIQISLIQTKDGTSGNLVNDNVQAIARAYADFTPTNTGGPVVNLPVVLVGGAYQYNMTVLPGVTYYLDPAVAVGYDYAIGSGNPNFASLMLPTGIGDGLFDLYGFDANNQLVLLKHDLSGGSVYSFAAGGVAKFRVAGIEVGAALDPANATAFVTGLTFTAAGDFTGTQTPILAVPEPAVALLFAAGLGVVGWARRHGTR